VCTGRIDYRAERWVVNHPRGPSSRRARSRIVYTQNTARTRHNNIYNRIYRYSASYNIIYNVRIVLYYNIICIYVYMYVLLRLFLQCECLPRCIQNTFRFFFLVWTNCLQSPHEKSRPKRDGKQ